MLHKAQSKHSPLASVLSASQRGRKALLDSNFNIRPMRSVLGAKVPLITVWFWVLKLSTTALGEAASDYLLKQFGNAGVASVTAGFVLALSLQLWLRRYNPFVYWTAVAMVAVFGTMAADLVHGDLGVPLWASTLCCALAVAVTFAVWRRTEGTLSIHSVTTRRREMFYWLAVSFTFALGTAAGDLTAGQLGLGFSGSIVLFAVVIAVPALGWSQFTMNGVLAFWWAYIVTRPLGASIADWLSKPPRADALGLGDGPVAAVLLVVTVALVTGVALRGAGAPAQSSARTAEAEMART